MNPIRKSFEWGGRSITLETGRVARQATGAVLASMGETTVLCTVVGASSADPGKDFFPLSVHYQERTYAAGRIPGGFFKREGRPSEKETLTSRLIDRPLRPLFPEGFKNEVQVVCTVMSAEPEVDPDIIALIGASAALSLSGIPFGGPVGAARVGFSADQGYVLNPTPEQLSEGLLDMVVGAGLYADQEMQPVIQVIDELVQEAGKPRWDWQPESTDEALRQALLDNHQASLTEAYLVSDKLERQQRIAAVRSQALEALAGGEEPAHSAEQVLDAVKELEKEIVRNRILDGEPRIDGRDLSTVRPIAVEVAMLPRAHGSSLFTRGETQAIGAATLGSMRDAQLIDALNGSYKDHFMLHYNFPPYSVGECGRMGGAGRREIGHGRLARRGLAAVLPTVEEFPYSIRVVSEVTESNGSSSMASVCVASLALMDAGVPVKAPVAGVAMGLVKEGDRFAVLTDILGDEDHLGDMDFKVAGTASGVTALQMDIKIAGIDEAIMEQALNQAHQARLHILGQMNEVLDQPRASLSENAPTMVTIRIDADKIRDVIGKGGATIRALTEETQAQIDIEDDGTILIYGADKSVADAAVERIEAITAEAEVGAIYTGKVKIGRAHV